MWNQWSSVPILTAPLPPLPTSAVQTQPPLPSAPPPPPPAVSSSEQTSVNSVPFIGPTMPGMPITASAGSAMTTVPTVDQTNPYSQYTAAQYATMTPDQQYAFQQHWQQWQAYQQEYAKWHAQYGEQYKREIAAAAVATGVSGATSYAGYFPQQPAVQPFQQPPPLPLSKPKEETVQTQNKISCKISGEPQMYNKPPPPLPQATSHNATQQSQWIQPFSHINVNFSQPPPQLNVRSNFSTSQINEINVQKPPPQVLSNRNQMITNPATNPSPSAVTEIPQLGYSKPSISDNYIIDKKINATVENSENNDNTDKTETYNYVEQERECNDETNNQSGIESVFKNSKSMWDHNMSSSREDQNTINITRSDRSNWQKNDFSAGNFAVDREQRKSSFNNECWESNSTLINRKSYNNMNRNNSWVQGSSNTGQNCGAAFTTIDRTPQPFNSNYKQNQQRKVPDLDEESFDRQFRQWEEGFEKWKTANANNPDREMYLQYEREFEKQRQRIIERRNNMRKRKMEQNNLNENQNQNQIHACNESSYEYGGFENKIKSNSSELSEEFLVAEDTGNGMENTNVLEKVSAADMQTVDEKTLKQFVGKQEEESYDTRKVILGKRKTRFSDASNDAHKNEITVSEVINLAEDSDDERTKVISKEENTNKKINEIFDKNSGIPGLDLIGEVEPFTFKEIDKVSEEKKQRQEAKQDFCEPTSATKTKKIPSLFDIVVEDPNKSPNPSGVVEGSQHSGNISPTVDNRSMLSNVSIVTNSLQDPNVLHNITKALAHVQGLPNLPTQAINLVNAPEIIEKLPALLQIVQQQQQHQQKFSENRSFATGNFVPDVLGMGGQSNCHNEQNFNKNQHLNDGGSRGNSFRDKIENYCRNDSNDNRFGSSFSNASWINSYNDTDQGGNNYDGVMIRGDGNFKGNDRHFQNRHRFQEGKIRNHTRTDIKQNFGGSIRGRKGNDNKRGSINRDNEDRNPINNMEDNTKNIDCVKNNSTGSKKSKIQNPFRRDAVAMPIFNDEINKAVVTKKEGNSSWNNNSGQDEYFVSNMRVFEYKVNGTVPPKIFDYGHKPVLKSDDYKPVKTIDYGHASKVKTNYSPNNESRQNEFGRVPNNDDNRDISEDALDKETSNNQSVQISGGLDKSNVKNSSLITNPNAADDIYKYNPEDTKKLITSEDLEEISDTEEGTTQRERSESPPPPPPLMYSSSKPASVFPSTAEANKEILKISSKRIGMSAVPKTHNHNTVAVDEIILNPGRSTRPAKICILIRGPPGSGKSHVAKLLKEKEILMGNSHVRILSIDDYFIVENDYEEICSKSGKKVPKKELLYEYDKDMEETYLQYLIKAFKKTINDNFYDFIIIDCNNNTMRSLNEFYFYAKDSGYMPYIVDLKCDVELCLNRNIHERSKQDIEEILKSWDTTPTNYIKLDVNTILENTVEMEDANDMVVENIIESGSLEDTLGINEKTLEKNYESNDDSNDTRDSAKTCGFLKSKWENDTTSENLARLDGITKSISKRKAASMEDYLQLDECHTAVSDGKKRVRWADIEESRKQDQMRAIGFVVGQTDWQRMMDPNAAKRALNKTKYIERVQKRNS